MKKIISILLVACMVLSLSSCKKHNSETIKEILVRGAWTDKYSVEQYKEEKGGYSHALKFHKNGKVTVFENYESSAENKEVLSYTITNDTILIDYLGFHLRYTYDGVKLELYREYSNGRVSEFTNIEGKNLNF